MNESNENLLSRALAMLNFTAEQTERMPPDEMAKLLHQIQAHQTELENQNEALRQAQTELVRSRDRYSNLYELAPVGYLTLDQNDVIRQANLTAATMLDVDRNDLIGRQFRDFVSKQSQNAWQLHQLQAFSEPTTVASEIRMSPLGSGFASFRVQSMAFPDAQGNLNQCRVTLSDDSERRIAFDALRKRNSNLDESLLDTSHQLDRSMKELRLLSEAVAHLGEGVMITGDNLDWPGPEIIFVNAAMCRIAGYEAHELVGKSPRILQGKATSPDATIKIRNDLQAGGTCLIDLVNYHKDGTPYDIELFITPLYDASGKRRNFVAIQRDVTERKRMEEELRREHELNSCILNTSQNVTLVLDNDGRILQFNPYLEKITGYRFDEVQGHDWFKTFLPEADRPAIQRVFENAVAGRPTKGKVNPILTKDGQLRYIEWFDTPLTDSQGNLVGLLCTGQDVTQRLELEQHILDIASEERRRIGTDLHDGVGQELTGLSMVADSLAVALERESRPEFQLAEKIKRGLLRTLDQVRTLSRGMNPVDIDAQGLMSALSEMSMQLSELDGVECTFQCDDPVLLRDNETATQLFRIAQEATTNAIRHGHAKLITISLQRFDHAVVLRVVDNGGGIDPSDSRSPGMGMRTMAYRARMIRGEFETCKSHSGGTEVICSVRVSS